MKISVIGLGKLGLCTACSFAAAGHKVVGLDVNEAHVAELAAGRTPIRETGLEELHAMAGANLKPTTDYGEAVANSEASLIIVPTPSLDDGGFDNSFVIAALEAMAPHIRAKESFHIVNVVSTVMPGSCDTVFRPLLEELTGKRCGEDFGLVYNPEFIALGSVIANFHNPDLVLIGASDQRSARIVKSLYESMVENEPRYALMSLINAEITKLSLNCFVTMKISFANELAAICERVPGADVDAVTDALGADERIGGKCLKAGLGFGGPCFPRDNLAFQRFATQAGREARLGPQVVAVNDEVVERLLRAVSKQVNKGGTVALFGLSYKPGTHITEESHAATLAGRLLAEGYVVRAHDPLARDEELIGAGAVFCEDAYDCARGADAALFLTDWPEYRELDLDRLEDLLAQGSLVLGAWRNFNGRESGKVRYAALGRYGGEYAAIAC